MGFFTKLFSTKNAGLAAQKEAAKKCEAAQLAEQIQDRLFHFTKKPGLAFALSEEDTGLFDSKLGGAFYVPEDQPVPLNTDSEPLYLLAQLNFNQLPPVADFPQQGLLQIFIDGADSMYGIDLSDPANQKNWCIRYLPEFPAQEMVPASCIYNPAWTEEAFLPFLREGAYRLMASPMEQAITISDWQVSNALVQYCSDLLPADFQNVYDLDDDVFEAWNDATAGAEENAFYACQIGGYPTFTQYDPREDEEGAPDVLLFQLDSVADIMWGDCGIGNFFIQSEDLRNLDFSKVWYNWDCC